MRQPLGERVGVRGSRPFQSSMPGTGYVSTPNWLFMWRERQKKWSVSVPALHGTRQLFSPPPTLRAFPMPVEGGATITDKLFQFLSVYLELLKDVLDHFNASLELRLHYV